MPAWGQKKSPSQASAGGPISHGTIEAGPIHGAMRGSTQPTLKTSCDPQGLRLSPHRRCLRSGFAPDLVDSPQRATERSFAATLSPQQRRWLAQQSALLIQQGRFDALDALAAEWDDEGWDPTAPQDVAA